MRWSDAKAQFEREYWEGLMARVGDNVTHAAREAGVDRSYVYKRLARIGRTFQAPRGHERWQALQ